MVVLAIDIGNTTIAFTGLEVLAQESADHAAGTGGSHPPYSAAEQDGGCEDFRVLFEEKISTETGKDIPAFIREAEEILARSGFDRASAVAVSSVVPACTPAAVALAERICSAPPTIISWKSESGLSFENIPAPEKVGADRIADSAWAARRYPLPVMTVDMGTATTINIVSTEREFLGGMIGAGVRTSLRALRSGTAQLPDLEPGPVPPQKLIGADTAGCMLSAAVVGTAAMIDGIAARVEERLGAPLTLVLTGGNAPAVSDWIRHKYIYEPDLAAKGSALIALSGSCFSEKMDDGRSDDGQMGKND